MDTTGICTARIEYTMDGGQVLLRRPSERLHRKALQAARVYVGERQPKKAEVRFFRMVAPGSALQPDSIDWLKYPA